ncbi:ABC transporter permease [Spirillospora sp. NBC_00431]
MKELAGTRGLIRLILRRDRFLLPLWILVPVFGVLNFLSATENLYPTAADRAKYAETTGTNSGFLAMFGPLYDTNTGAVVAQRIANAPLLLALFSLLTVIRHTRTDEEHGRREVLGATAVGRHAFLAAALTVTFAANLLAALIIGIGMSGRGQPTAGAFALGFAFAGVGCLFAAVGGLAAQLTFSAGAARGIALGVLGAAYLLRASGDAGGSGNSLSWLSWLSPIGWAHRVRPFADERWWVLALPIALVIVLSVAAMVLSTRRDLGAGIVQPKLGPASAAPALRGPKGLAWRLHRGPLLAWTGGFLIFGLALGGVAGGVGTLVEDNPDVGDLITRAGGQNELVDAYLAAMLSLMALVASGFTIQGALRLRAEEADKRAEPVLSTPVTRMNWLSSHLLFAIVGPVIALAALGLMVGLVHGIDVGDVGGQVGRALGGALIQLPAVWLLTGLTIAAYGWLPRAAPAVAWAALGVSLVCGQLGAMLQMSQGLRNVSPFTHIPRLPGGDFDALPLIVLLCIAAACVGVGMVAFRRRDVPAV